MKLRHYIALFLLSAQFCAAAESGVSARQERWNIRIAPSLDADVVSSVESGTKLQILGRHGDWYEIVPPAGVEAWVAAVFVNADGTLKPDARLRSGPGVIYPEFKYKSPESPLKIEKKDDGVYENGWYKMVLKSGISCYVHKKFSSGILLSGKEDSPEDIRRVRRDNYMVTMEGIPVRLEKPFEDASYKLVLEINGRQIHLCYLVSPHLNLNLWENRMVRVVGHHRWIKDVPRPFLEIEKVFPSWK